MKSPELQVVDYSPFFFGISEQVESSLSPSIAGDFDEYLKLALEANDRSIFVCLFNYFAIVMKVYFLLEKAIHFHQRTDKIIKVTKAIDQSFD